ncbi:sulfate/molybdate ABC transporter ATP-binding protein [Herbiconiux daphne]|uniref:ABC transporter ATP-binding protein n=1 Tax=Herbiconiux daphne TaxID=2970914 RepID=A0ABT2H3F2_9MICO|nr:ABC transporter ATP-binding protein [Herbiconiux daphne]MCS5734452.1 ABC transporter ATP-binding protein [Herbiconiux daphne]
MTLEFAAVLRSRGFAVQLTVAAGETVAVLGPNGAGKSTLLGVIAGLIRPDSGRARLNERVLFDLGERGGGRWSRPHQRGVSLLAQDALLFPHLSALDNVAFGPRSAGVPRAESDSRARAWLERVDAVDLAGRKPAQLSGGQAQRIAVARALASEPDLLLLDEPMAALDVSVAPALRRMLRDVLRDRSAIIVTHDVLDAFTLADRVVVLEGGRIVDAGPTRHVLERPSTTFAAGLAGLNRLAGTADTESVVTDAGDRLRVRFTEPVAPGVRVAVAVRPALVAIAVEAPASDDPATNVVAGHVIDLETRGDLVRVRSGTLAADVTPGRVADLDVALGTEVWFSFRAEDALAYPQ